MKQNKKISHDHWMYHNNLYIHSSSLIGWNHMVKITKGPKNEKEIGYYQWNHDQMDSF